MTMYKIKQLEWVKGDGDQDLISTTPIGFYLVYPYTADGPPRWLLSFYKGTPGSGMGYEWSEWASDKDDAMSKAQAHFNDMALKFLEPAEPEVQFTKII